MQRLMRRMDRSCGAEAADQPAGTGAHDLSVSARDVGGGATLAGIRISMEVEVGG